MEWDPSESDRLRPGSTLLRQCPLCPVPQCLLALRLTDESTPSIIRTTSDSESQESGLAAAAGLGAPTATSTGTAGKLELGSAPSPSRVAGGGVAESEFKSVQPILCPAQYAELRVLHTSARSVTCATVQQGVMAPTALGARSVFSAPRCKLRRPLALCRERRAGEGH